MRSPSTITKDSTPAVKNKIPWRVVSVQAEPGFRLLVHFIDGTQGEVDMSRMINGTHAGVFTVLRDSTLFEQVFLDHAVVTWPGELDLAPDAMYDAIKAEGRWVLE